MAAYADTGSDATGATVVHVRAGATASAADGSAERPYATIGDGLRRAGDDGWVLVAEGTYEETLRLSGGARAHVLGVCAARVTLRGTTRIGAMVELRGAATVLDLRGVKVAQGGVGADVSDGASLRARGVAFSENRDVNVRAQGAGTQVELDSCLVYDPDPSAGALNGGGVEALAGARVDLVSTAIAYSTAFGVHAENAATRVTLSRSVVKRTLSNGSVGVGIEAVDGATLAVSESLLVANARIGVRGVGVGTEVSLTTTRVRDTEPVDGVMGDGVVVRDGALLRAAGLIVERNGTAGVVVSGPGARAELRGGLVCATRPMRDGVDGMGLRARGGAAVTLEGMVFDGNTRAGVYATDTNTRVTLVGSVVRQTRRDGSGTGRGVEATSGASVEVSRCALSDNASEGAVVNNVLVENNRLPEGVPAARMTLRDSIIRGARPPGGSAQSLGILVTNRGTMSASGLLVLDCTGFGINTAAPGSRLDLVSSAVRGTRSIVVSNPQGAPGSVFVTFGRGLQASSGSRVNAIGLLVEDSVETGIMAVDAGTRFWGTEVLITGVRPSGRGMGIGLHAFAQAVARLSRLTVLNTSGAGLAAHPWQQYPRSEIHVSDAYVRDVATHSVRFSGSGQTAEPVGERVSYGLFADLGTVVRASRAVVEEGGYGFYNASGSLRLSQGLIGRQDRAAGATECPSRAPDSVTSTEGLTFWDNATDEVGCASLPVLAPPTAVDAGM